MEEQNAKISFQSKSCSYQIESYYIMDLKGALLDSERTLLHSLPKSGRAMAPLAPRFLRPCVSASSIRERQQLCTM